jgi:hypothetical protein
MSYRGSKACIGRHAKIAGMSPRSKQCRKKIRAKKKVFDYKFKREARARANEKIQVYKLTEEI